MMQYQATAVVVVVIFVAILAQLELESEPLLAKRSVTLSAGKDETFRMITDIPKFQKWMSLVLQVTGSDPADRATTAESIGRPFRLHVSCPLKTLEFDARVTRLEPPSTFEFEAGSTLLGSRLLFEVEDGHAAGFSRLTLRIYAKRRSYLYLVCVVQPLKFILSQHVTASLFNIKVMLQ